MKCSGLILLLVAVALSNACSPGSSRSGTPNPLKSPALGTGDPGGGDPKTAKNYSVNVTELPEYIKYVKPVSDSIDFSSSTSVDTGCGNLTLLDQVAKMKSWYIAPSTTKTAHSGALQTDDEIWIDASTWNALSEKDRGKLLMRQIVESIYRFRFMDWNDVKQARLKNCQNSSNSGHASAQTGVALTKLEPTPPSPEPRRALENDDYKMINYAAEYLTENYSRIKDNASLQYFFMSYRFDPRLYPDVKNEIFDF